MTRRLVPATLLAVVAAPTVASTPAAWADERRAARAACVTASGLVAPTVTPPTGFDDSLPVDGLLLTGRIRVRRGIGPRVTMLCLYDRRERRARATEATGWPTVR